MAKKNRTTNNGTPKGIFRIREAGKNPANKKMFDAIINGDVDENIVDGCYTEIDIEFVINELDCVCRVLTRDKIQAYPNNINHSIETLANQFIQGLNTKDVATEMTQKIVDDVAATFESDDDDVKRIVVMSIIRNAIIGATDVVKTINVAANDSAIPEGTDNVKIDVIPPMDEPVDTSEVIDVDVSKVDEEKTDNDIATKIMNNPLVKAVINTLSQNPDSLKEMVAIFSADNNVLESINMFDMLMSAIDPDSDAGKILKELFGDNTPEQNTEPDKDIHDIRKEKVSESVNAMRGEDVTKPNCVALVESKPSDKTGTQAPSDISSDHGTSRMSVVSRIREANRTMFDDINDIYIRAGILPATN